MMMISLVELMRHLLVMQPQMMHHLFKKMMISAEILF